MSTEQLLSEDELKTLNLTQDDVKLLKSVKSFVSSKQKPKLKTVKSSSGKKRSEYYKILHRFVIGADNGKTKIDEEFKANPDELKKTLVIRRKALRSACNNLTSKEDITYADVTRVLKASSNVILDLPKPEVSATVPVTDEEPETNPSS